MFKSCSEGGRFAGAGYAGGVRGWITLGGREESWEGVESPPLSREGQKHSGRSVVSPVGRVVLHRGLLGGQGRGPLTAHRGCWERGGV